MTNKAREYIFSRMNTRESPHTSTSNFWRHPDRQECVIASLSLSLTDLNNSFPPGCLHEVKSDVDHELSFWFVPAESEPLEPSLECLPRVDR